jgi:isoaspartyl peptidase/L-asparaginase-like protein (Ntn-hydrolase superfamily)
VDGNSGYPLEGRIDDIGAVAIDAKGRPIVAGGENRIQLMRFTAAGKADSRFAPKGTFSRHLSDEATGTVEALALDAKGRIYVAGKFSGATGKGIRIVRVLPAS